MLRSECCVESDRNGDRREVDGRRGKVDSV